MIQLDDDTLWEWHVDHIHQQVMKSDHDTPASSSADQATDHDSSPFITYPLQASGTSENVE